MKRESVYSEPAGSRSVLGALSVVPVSAPRHHNSIMVPSTERLTSPRSHAGQRQGWLWLQTLPGPCPPGAHAPPQRPRQAAWLAPVLALPSESRDVDCKDRAQRETGHFGPRDPPQPRLTLTPVPPPHSRDSHVLGGLADTPLLRRGRGGPARARESARGQNRAQHSSTYPRPGTQGPSVILAGRENDD